MASRQLQLSDQMKDLILKKVIFGRGRELGRGAYGRVCTAEHAGLICAAKEIHALLLDGVSPEEKRSLSDGFMRECLQASRIHHPNIVQFMGVYYPSEQADLPIMVMELLDTNVTGFVEKNKSKIADKTKTSILHDVSLGLSHLHCRDPPIVHRDLSSNNVLLTSSRVAKISDLGMAKMIRADSKQTKSRLTTAPGTLHFMPPEALVEVDPIYGTPVDVFSFAAVGLHLFSEEWPTPGAQKGRDPRTKKLVALSETERRQKYLDKMTSVEAAAFKPTILQCLDDDPDERPPIEQVSQTLKDLKTTDSGVQKLTSQLEGATVSSKPAKPKQESPSFAEALQGGQYHIKWNTCANLPSPLYGASVAVSGTTVYTAASAAPDVATPPGHMMGVLHMIDGRLCIFGGQDSVTYKTSKKVTSYNTITNSWYSRYPDMIIERFQPGVVTYRDYVIVMGGQDKQHTILNTIEVMNYCQHLQWKEVSTKLPVGMWDIRPTISGEKISIVGHTSSGLRYTTSYEITADDVITTPDQLPPTGKDNRWKQLTTAPHYNTATVPNSSPAVIIGGDNKGVTTTDVSLYDTSKKSWVRVDALTSPRNFVGVALVNATTIIIIGGTSGGGSVEASKASSLVTVEIGQITPNY